MRRYFPVMFDGFLDPAFGGKHAADLMNSMAERMGMFPDGMESGLRMLSARADMYRSDGKIIVETELPGVKADKVELHVYGDRMTISAEKSADENAKERSYLSTERVWGRVERVFSFPVEVEPDSAKAAFKDGVLCVEVAEKSRQEAHKKVEISAED